MKAKRKIEWDGEKDKQLDEEKYKGNRKPHSKCSFSTSAEVAADVAQWYGCVCLINEFMTTWYTDTQLQFTYSHHFSECIAATQHTLGLLHHLHCACFMCLHPHMWLEAEILELERKTAASEDITSSHLYPSLSLSLSTLITCFIFLLVPFLQSDILAVIYLSFQISHKSFYLPLSFQPFFPPKLPPSSSLAAP